MVGHHWLGLESLLQCGILVVNANRVSSLRILAPCCDHESTWLEENLTGIYPHSFLIMRNVQKWGWCNRGTWTALPLVDAARHNDVKPKLGRELMILTHDDDDDDDVCMYVMKQSAGLVLTTLNGFVIVGLEIVVVLCCFSFITCRFISVFSSRLSVNE